MHGNNIHTYEKGQHGRYTAISRKVVGKSARQFFRIEVSDMSHITFRDRRVHIFANTDLSRNECRSFRQRVCQFQKFLSMAFLNSHSTGTSCL